MKKIFCSVIFLVTAIHAFAQDLPTAIRLSESEQFELAKEAFDKLLAADSKNGALYYYAGENYFEADNLDSALVLFSKGANEAPQSAYPYVGIGKVALYSGDEAAARTAFDKAIQISAMKDPKILVEIADAYINADKKDLDKALVLLQNAEKLDPKNPQIQLLLGDRFLATKDPTAGSSAIKHYEKAQTLNPKSPAAKVRIGRLWSMARNYSGAAESFKEAIAIDPDFAPAYRELGELYALAGRFPEAKENYKKYLELNNKSQAAKVRYAQFLYMTKDYKESLSNIEEVWKTDTSHAILNRFAAYNFYETGHYEKGLQYMEKFLNNPKNIKILPKDYAYYGKLLSRQGKDSLALEKLNTAIELDTANADLLTDQATILMKLKRYDQAIQKFQQKIEMKKANATDYFKMGQAYYNIKDYANADSAFAVVTTTQPNFAPAHLWRGRANSGLDPDSKEGLAKPHYETFIEKANADEANVARYTSDLVEAHSYLGFYYLVKKDTPAAKVHWETVLKLDPKNEKAKAALNGMK